MTNADFIRSLAEDLPPVSPGKARTDLLFGLAGGGAVSLAIILLCYGVQPGLLGLSGGGALLMKAAYALSLAAIAASLLLPIMRARDRMPDRRVSLLLVILLLAALALVQTAMAPPAAVARLWIGSSWRLCPLRVVVLSAPIFAGLCWAIRRQAPVRLRAAGAAAGLLSGGIAATLYGLACREAGAGFVLVWYSLGILLGAAIGALLGPRVLRW